MILYYFHHLYGLIALVTILFSFSLARSSKADSFRPIFFALLTMVLMLTPYVLEHILGGVGYSQKAPAKFAIVQFAFLLFSLLAIFFGIVRAKWHRGRRKSISFIVGRDILAMIVLLTVVFYFGELRAESESAWRYQGIVLLFVLLLTKKGAELSNGLMGNDDEDERVGRFGKGFQAILIISVMFGILMTSIDTIHRGTVKLLGDEIEIVKTFVNEEIIEATDNMFYEGQVRDIFDAPRVIWIYQTRDVQTN